MTHAERIGSKVAALRRAKGWSAQKLATEARLSRSVIANLENGRKSDVSVQELFKLAAALEVFPGDLASEAVGDILKDQYQSYSEEELALWARGKVRLEHSSMGDYWKDQAVSLRRLGRFAKRQLDQGLNREEMLQNLEEVALALPRAEDRALLHYRASGTLKEGEPLSSLVPSPNLKELSAKLFGESNADG